MENLLKKIVSITLAFLLVLTYVPVGAIFAEVETIKQSHSGNQDWPHNHNFLNVDTADLWIEGPGLGGKVDAQKSLKLKVGKKYTVHLTMFLSGDGGSEKLFNFKDFKVNGTSFSGALNQSHTRDVKATIEFEADNIGKYHIVAEATRPIVGHTHYYEFDIAYEPLKDADEFTPKGNEVKVTVGEDVPEAKRFVSFNGASPEQVEYTFENELSTQTAGEYEVKVKVTYQDSSYDMVIAKLVVVEKPAQKVTIEYKKDGKLVCTRVIEPGENKIGDKAFGSDDLQPNNEDFKTAFPDGSIENYECKVLLGGNELQKQEHGYKVNFTAEEQKIVVSYTAKPVAPTPDKEVELTAKFYFSTILDGTVKNLDYTQNIEAFYPLNDSGTGQLVGTIKGDKETLDKIDAHTEQGMDAFEYWYGDKKIDFSSKESILDAFSSIKDQEIQFTNNGEEAQFKLSDSPIDIQLMRLSKQKSISGQSVEGESVIHVDLRITRKEGKEITVKYYLDGTEVGEYNNTGKLNQSELQSLQNKKLKGNFGTVHTIDIPTLKAFNLKEVTNESPLSPVDGKYQVTIGEKSQEIEVYFVSKPEYKITFDVNGGVGTIEAQSVYEGDRAQKPSEQPTREGHKFEGWYEKEGDGLKSDSFSFETPVKNHITLYAKWTALSSAPTEEKTGNEQPNDTNPPAGGEESKKPEDNGNKPTDPKEEEPKNEDDTVIDDIEEETPLSSPDTDDKEESSTEEDTSSTPDKTTEEVIDLEEEGTPLGTAEDTSSTDQPTEEVINLEEEGTPLGTAEEASSATEQATEEIDLEEEGTPLGTAEQILYPPQTVVINLEEEPVALSGLPYTAQASYTFFMALGGIFVSLGFLFKRMAR